MNLTNLIVSVFWLFLLQQRHLADTPGLCCQRALAGCSRSASCCSTHLVLNDLPGRDVGAKLLQRVDDLAPRADRDHTVEDSVQRVDAGILGKQDGGRSSVQRLQREVPRSEGVKPPPRAWF